MDELRLAFRRLWKRPGSTLAAMATLACAIGAAAVTWSALEALLVRPLPVQDPGTLVQVSRLVTTGAFAGTLQRGIDYEEFRRVRESGLLPSAAAAWGDSIPLLVKSETAAPHHAQTSFITHDLLDLLGVDIAAGRGFGPDDDVRGAMPVAILSNHYWRRTWNAGEAVGQSIVINNQPVAIVGVAPPGFRGLSLAETADLFLPFHVIALVAGGQMNYFAESGHLSSPTADVRVVARTGGISPAEITARLASLTRAGDDRPLAAAPLVEQVIPIRTRDGVQGFSRLLAGTVSLLVLIGCSTVGMLLLVSTEARRIEFATCLALGATRLRLVRGIVVEGLLLACGGVVFAIPISQWLFGLLRSHELPGGIALETLELSLTLAAFLAAGATALLVVAAVAVVAGLFGFSADIAQAVRQSAGATQSSGRGIRPALVGIQVAVALCLMAGAGLFVKSVLAALQLNAAIDPARLITGGGFLGPYGYDAIATAQFFDAFAERLRAHPAIEAITFHQSRGGMAGPMPIDGVRRAFGGPVNFKAVDEAFFSTIGIPVLRGRSFTSSDTSKTPLVGIVSESFGRALADGGDPIGRRVTMPYGEPRLEILIVGVVPDIVTNVATLEPLVLYMPLRQQPAGGHRDFTIRASDDVSVARGVVLTVFRELDPDVIPGALPTLEEQIARQMTSQRFAATVFGALGTIAVLLTLLGSYVQAETMATIRMRELGIRAALGATLRQLGAIVLAQTVRTVGLGLLAGLGLAWLGAGTIQSFLFDVQPLDPTILAAVALSILLLSLGASLRAALRAARVDLSTVLKAE